MQPKPVTTTTDFSCPACGFRVFNRRYPKCERCRTALPTSLLLSEQERQALLKGEEQQLRAEWERSMARRARASMQARARHLPSYAPGTLGAPSEPTATGGWSSPSTSSDTFTSGGGGVFDGGGASDSFGGDSSGSGGGNGS